MRPRINIWDSGSDVFFAHANILQDLGDFGEVLPIVFVLDINYYRRAIIVFSG